MDRGDIAKGLFRGLVKLTVWSR